MSAEHAPLLLAEDEPWLRFLRQPWYEYPVCQSSGTWQDLLNFGRSCCRDYLAELEGD